MQELWYIFELSYCQYKKNREKKYSIRDKNSPEKEMTSQFWANPQISKALDGFSKVVVAKTCKMKNKKMLPNFLQKLWLSVVYAKYQKV